MTARSGAFCSPPGATGTTVNGTPMRCTPYGTRARWAGAAAPDPRKAALKAARAAGVKIKRNTPLHQILAQVADARQADAPPAAAPPLRERVLAAAHSLLGTGGYGSSMGSLVALRDALPDVSRAELDAAILELDRERIIQLDPDPLRWRHTDRIKEAAIPMGGEQMNVFSIRT